MSTLAIVLLIAALLFFGVGIFVEALKFLLVVAAILAVAAVIVWLVRYLRGGRTKV
ncbi:membrane protein [Microbacterium phage Cece]|nr:membrane protein [Microbacterium phage Cece]